MNNTLCGVNFILNNTTVEWENTHARQCIHNSRVERAALALAMDVLHYGYVRFI